MIKSIPHSAGWKWIYHLEGMYPSPEEMNYLEFFCKEDSFLLPYLFMQSFIYINMDSDIYWVIIKYCDFFVVHDFPALVMVGSFHLTPIHALHACLIFFLLRQSLTFWHCKILQVHLVFPTPDQESDISSRSHEAILKCVLENETYQIRVYTS